MPEEFESSNQSVFSTLSDAELRQELVKCGIPFGPIVQSTRKVYEKKLLNASFGREILANGNGETENGIMDGNGGDGRSPSRETSPLIDQQPSVGFIENDRKKKSPTPAGNDAEEGSDNDDDDNSESARVLTPDEMRHFRANFTSVKTIPPNGNIRYRGQAARISKITANKAVPKNSSSFKYYAFTTAILITVGSLVTLMFWMREYLVPTLRSIVGKEY